MKWHVAFSGLVMFVFVIQSVLGVYVEELGAKLDDPVFERLPDNFLIGLKVFGNDWGDIKRVFAFTSNHFYELPVTDSLVATDFVLGVKEGFLDTVLRVSDLCRFGSGLPRNPDQYRVLSYDWWGFVWKYRCFSEGGCLKKFCEGVVG